ncbi:AsnC family protein [Natrialba swarupiae]|nr:AsnC family protein [Natrialba swarupiae]
MPQELDGLDEIDRTILRILVQNPRTPYSDIAEQLEDEGFEMSGEGIRYRVSKLFETTSILLLTAPKQHGWEVIRLFIAVEDNEDAKKRRSKHWRRWGSG